MDEEENAASSEQAPEDMEKLTDKLTIRLSPRQKQMIIARAKERGMKPGQYARRVVMRTIRKAAEAAIANGGQET